MNRPQMETMESRLLLTAGVLGAGLSEAFDLDGNGVEDAVLANLGTSDLAYEYTEGLTGFDVINVVADGAAFRTNTWVGTVGDTDASDDFDLTKVLLGARTKFAGVWYDPILGDSALSAGSIAHLELGTGGSLAAETSEGDLLKVLLRDETVVDLSSAGNIGKICSLGDLSGSIHAAGDIDVLAAGNLSGISIQAGGALNKLVAESLTDGSSVQVQELGRLIVGRIDGGSFISVTGDAEKIQACSMEDMMIITGGDLNCLWAGTISGEASFTSIAVAGHMNCLHAQTITGGVNGMLDISIDAGLDNLCVGRLDGGEAVDGGFVATSLSVTGTLDNFCAGQIVGGQADGAGSFVMLNLTVQDLMSGDDVLEAGDIGRLRVGGISGGETTDSGMVILQMNVSNDLVDAWVGRVSGTGVLPTCADPSVSIGVGHDIVKFVAGEITGGSAVGSGASANVWIAAGNDIQKFSAGRIHGGTAVGASATTQVYISAGGDIGELCAGSITGGQADGEWASSSVTLHATNDIEKLCSAYIGGGSSANGASAQVKIVAEHDIVNACLGTILGSENGHGGCDPAVQIQAYNDIKNFSAWRIIAGQDGLVNILAGIDGDGNVSGDDGLGGAIENMFVCMINGQGGVVNIAAGGDIDYLRACCIFSGNGEVNVIASGDITADVWCVQGWIDGEETGVEFSAGGEVNDLRGSIREEFITEGEPVELPTPI
ncbi:MAG: hypothetical protein JW849_04445 [Phycisphaerae bacterium]|nr:hypothetical protein [Phycisphaerae bacterium]